MKKNKQIMCISYEICFDFNDVKLTSNWILIKGGHGV